MASGLVKYVLLRFSPDPQSEGLLLLLAEACPGQSLEVTASPTWHDSLPAQDRDYLTSLVEDWQRTPPEQVPDLFHQLEQLSHGSLRPIEMNSTTPGQYLSLKRMIVAQRETA